MKIFFHIGLHKTGSSYIQKVLYNNSELLIQKNFFYKTNTPEEFNHNSLAELVLDFSKNKILLSDIFNRYINEALELKCHTIIFSSEMLAVIDEVTVKSLSSLFSGHELNIVAYIRRPDEVIKSSHNQIVKDSKWPRDLNERPFPYDPSFFSILNSWLRNFLPGNLIFCPFDKDQFKHLNIALDFLSTVGLKDIKDTNLVIQDIEANISLPENLIQVIRLTNAVLNLSHADHAKWVNALDELRFQYPKLYPYHEKDMSRSDRKACFKALQKEMHLYRPYFRDGFDENFLRWKPLSLSMICKKIKQAIQHA